MISKKSTGSATAHSGVKPWLKQRISAVALMFLGGWLVYGLSRHGNDSYENIVIWLANPWTATGLFLFMVTSSYHAFLGLRVIIEDYLHSYKWHYGSLWALRILMFTLPSISLFFLIKIYLGNL